MVLSAYFRLLRTIAIAAITTTMITAAIPTIISVPRPPVGFGAGDGEDVGATVGVGVAVGASVGVAVAVGVAVGCAASMPTAVSADEG